MYMMSTYVKATLLAFVLTMLMLSLGACGNTIKGIGNDIVKIGENIIKEEPKVEK